MDPTIRPLGQLPVFSSSFSVHEAYQAVACTKCLKPAGQPCQSPSGRRLQLPHVRRCNAMVQYLRQQLAAKMGYCRSASDGECFAKDCPQIADCEPQTTGRHCPIDCREDDE